MLQWSVLFILQLYIACTTHMLHPLFCPSRRSSWTASGVVYRVSMLQCWASHHTLYRVCGILLSIGKHKCQKVISNSANTHICLPRLHQCYMYILYIYVHLSTIHQSHIQTTCTIWCISSVISVNHIIKLIKVGLKL